MSITENLKNNKQKIALAVGFVAVGCLGYFGGQSINKQQATSPAKSSVSSSSNYTQPIQTIQTAPAKKTTEAGESGALDCAGKIKGSSSMIYHMTDGAFYKRVTNPIRCFDTEAEAVSAGFRKSSK